MWYPLLALGLLLTPALAEFLGPLYPYPHDLSSDNSLVAAVWMNNITTQLDAFLKNDEEIATLMGVNIKQLTFSTGLFSTLDPEAECLQYFYTAPEVAEATNGTNRVDADSVYGMASMTKLFTVFAGMLTLSEEEWHRPLAQIFSEFVQPIEGNDPIRHMNFNEISAWSLATHMAGMPYWAQPNYDFITTYATELEPLGVFPEDTGLPPLNLDDLGGCWNIVRNKTEIFCPASEWLTVVANELYPQFEAWSSPSYSNGGMFLLGLTIGRLKNTTLEEIWQERIFDPLRMNSTSAHPVNDPDLVARGVIGDTQAAWLLDTSYAIGSGGLYSTLADITTFSKAVLDSTLLPPATTRRWMRPTTLTPSFSYAVGGPWEIHRYTSPTSGRITDLYTKSGDAGPHGGIIALIPEYKAGFIVLCEANNGTVRSTAQYALMDHIALQLLPALEVQAAAESTANYAGTYEASNLNSSITIAFNSSNVPGAVGGLSITKWISNGTDMMTDNFALTSAFSKAKLLPTIINEDEGKVAFYASTELQFTSYGAAGLGPFRGLYATNFDWLGISVSSYGNIALKELIFDLGADGKATAVTAPALRVEMKRVEEK